MDQQYTLAAKVFKRDRFPRKVGESERGEIGFQRKAIGFSFHAEVLLPSARNFRVPLEFIQTQQYSALARSLPLLLIFSMIAFC